MKTRNIFLGTVAILGLTAGLQSASANTICSGCEYIDPPGAVGTYIGQYNPTTFDNGSFAHTDIQQNVGNNASFTDFWVFDVNPGGAGSVSANFTSFAGIRNFAGVLYQDAGSTCGSAPGAPTACGGVGVIMAALGSGSGNGWEIMVSDLAAGRYVLQITGETRNSGPSTYTGQLAFAVPEPATLAMLGLGLLGMGVRRRKEIH